MINRRPHTLNDVAEWSESLEHFGMHLRDWQHEIERGGVHSRAELARRLESAPRLLSGQFADGDVADAYLAAYAEWLADRAEIPRPTWCGDRNRRARDPWFSSPARALLLVHAPGSFRQRNLFAIPEPVFSARRGRPRVSLEQKREKARLRQKAYRGRVRELVRRARAMGEE